MFTQLELLLEAVVYWLEWDFLEARMDAAQEAHACFESLEPEWTDVSASSLFPLVESFDFHFTRRITTSPHWPNGRYEGWVSNLKKVL